MKLPALLALSVLSAAWSARAAETVKLNDFTFTPYVGAVNPLNLDNGQHFITTITNDTSLPPALLPLLPQYNGAGQMSGLLNGSSFVAYCVQINVDVDFGFTYNDYNLVSAATGFGARAADLAKLLTWAGMAPAKPANAAESAALQAAVWEIVHETTAGPYTFSAGKLKTASNNAATQAALSNIESNWGTIMAINTPTVAVSRLDGANQDLLIFAPVPETSTVAMMALGLLGVGAAARKRQAG